MSNMFKCLADCADLDLVNDCTATDAAERRYPYPGQRVPGVTRQEASTGTGESVKRGEEEEGEEEEVEEEDEEDPAYDEGDINSLDEEGYPDEEQFDDSLEHAPDAGERTGEYPEDDASRQDITPRMSPVVGPPFMAQTQKPSLESGTSISRESEVSPSGSYDVAPAARYGAPVPPVPPFPSASVSEPAPAPAVAPDGTSAAEAHASAAAAEGLRASTGAADAVAAAAAAADAGSQEEAEAAADRAAKAAAIAASSAANALKLAQEAGKAAAAEQALVDSTAERGGVGMAQGSAVAIPEVETAPAPVPGASHEDDDPTPEMASPRPGQMEAAAEYDPRRPLSSVSSAVRSTSMGAPVASGDQSIGSVESTLSRQMPGRMSEPALSASPGATEVRSLQMPARMSEGERTRVMARRMQTDWAPEGAEETAAPRPRTFVSTRLRHLRLSQDGTTLVVKSEKGGVDHELALDELLEVHETPSEESVTLMGQDIEIRIAFKGQAKALRQFRTMLVPAGSATVVASPSTGNAAGGGNPPTTITTIREESPGEAASSPAQDRPASVVSLPRNGSENGSEGRVPVPVEVSTAGQYGAPLLSSSYSADTQRGAMGGDSGRFRLDATGAIDGDATRSLGNIGGSSGQQQQRQEGAGEGEGQVGGVEETEMPEGTANPPVSRNMSAASSFTSTGSAIDVLSKFDAQDRGADADAAAAAARGSCSGSTFADARERERVIAALQSDDNTMSPVEREAKLHLVKYEQAGFVRGYEALCDQQQVRLRKRPEFAELETIGVKEGLANPTIVLMQPNISESVEAHHADAIKAKEALDKLMDNISGEIQGLWVRPVPVKEESAVNSTANKDYAGDVRRVLDMARTSVICESPELVRQVVDRLKSHPDVSGVDRVKNGFGDTTVGRGGYRDIKVYLQLAGIAHYVEVQVHLREFYELNSRSHEVYEWARGVDLPEGTTPHLLFRNLSPDVQVEMTRLVKEDWMGLRRILPELLQATEQYSEAEPLLRQNVEEAEKRWIMAKNRFGEGHLHEMSCAQGVAMALNNLALALKGGGDTRGAEPLLRRALKMSEDSQGPDHPEVATRLNSLALLLASDGRVQEAEEMHRRALDIARKVYGPEHADVATYLNNLARVLKAQDKLGEAEPLQRSALSIGERMLGTNHSDVATYYNNLSRLVRAAGKLEEAEPLQRRAVEIGEQVLGPNSSDLATWVNNLGRLLMARKKLEEAKEVQERAVAIAENVYGPDHPQVARARKNLTKVQVALDKAGRSRGSGAPDTDMDA